MPLPSKDQTRGQADGFADISSEKKSSYNMFNGELTDLCLKPVYYHPLSGLSKTFSSFKPGVPFVGYRQTDKPQM